VRVIFMGPPNAGKGTQAQLLQEELQIPKLSTGDILRHAIAEGTEVGKQAKTFLDNGDLVPDSMIIDIVHERLTKADCAEGFILDGFPRTVAQAEDLDQVLAKHHLSLDFVFCLTVEDEVIIERQAGRRMAPSSGRVYHLKYNPPKVAGKCDITGEDLIHRPDDQEDVVRHRLDVYAQQTAPVLAYYQQKGLLVTLDGTTSIEDVHSQIMKFVNTRTQQKDAHCG